MPKNKTLKEIVGENVKAIMAAKKLTQSKVAAAAKKSGTPINQTTVSRVARCADPKADVDPPNIKTLEAIANGLGISPWQLLLSSGSDKKLLVLLEAWEHSGEQGKRLLELAAKGALERDAFEAAGGPADVAQSRRGRAG